MPQLDSDTFTYSNGNLATVSSAKWTKLSGFSDVTITSNQVVADNTARAAVITTWAGSATDHYSQAVASTATNEGGSTIRSDAASTFYHPLITADSFMYVEKVIAGTGTIISTTAMAALANGDTVYIEIQGTTIKTKKNGTVVNNFTDASIASGKPGIGTDTLGLVMDNWAAGDFSVAATGIANGSHSRPFPFTPGSPAQR